MLSQEEMVEICRDNDAKYDGIFYIAVKTTMIYCIPSCPARFPKRENISFYTTKQEAEEAGYRGCLRCHSANYQFIPDWIEDLVIYLQDNLDQKLTMTDLEQMFDMHRTTIAANFQQVYHMTPMQYYKKLKLDTAYRRIRQGSDYRDVAFSLGYTSISGFRSAFERYFEQTPGAVEVA